jgi:hypothetical protein
MGNFVSKISPSVEVTIAEYWIEMASDTNCGASEGTIAMDTGRPAHQSEGHVSAGSFSGTNYPAQGCAEMTEVAFRYASLVSKAILAATLLAIAGCATAPTEQSTAGLSPAGTVSITEDFVVGSGGGNGLLNYQGRTYPFKFVCTVLGPAGGGIAEVDRVLGPGGGRSKITASGLVYKLTSVADFRGTYTQSNGASDFWLQNSAGVIMHLQGARTGATELIPKFDEVAIQVSLG